MHRPISMAIKSLLLASVLGEFGTSEGTWGVLTLSVPLRPFPKVSEKWRGGGDGGGVGVVIPVHSFSNYCGALTMYPALL